MPKPNNIELPTGERISILYVREYGFDIPKF